MRTLALTAWFCVALGAQDITGRWNGVADSTDEAGTKRLENQTFEFTLENGALKGVLLSKTGGAGRLLDVQRDGAKFNLYHYLTLEGGEHLRWKFEWKDGVLVGTFSAQHNNPKKWVYDRIGAMTLKKL